MLKDQWVKAKKKAEAVETKWVQVQVKVGEGLLLINDLHLLKLQDGQYVRVGNVRD